MLADYLFELEQTFLSQANAEIAKQQKAYLKNQFEHFGIKTPVRRSITRSFLQKDTLPNRKDLPLLVKALWQKEQREFQSFGLDLCLKYSKKPQLHDLEMFEWMVITKSWWDTVDMVAVNMMGEYFKKYPQSINQKIPEWIGSKNIWLQRCAILFQLKYKEHINTDLLTSVIYQLKDTNEFFLNKAIGWILREFAKTNPKWVTQFTQEITLHSLSRREALRLIN